MQPKLITAALSLALGISWGGTVLAAGDSAAKQAKAANPKAAAQRASEDLLARTVFQTLLGEMALQQGDIKLGYDAWTDLALRTRDPKVVARAAEVASMAHQYDKALELTRLWLELEPDSTKAKQTYSSLLAITNRLDELAPQLAELLTQDKPNLANNLMHLNRLLARHSDKKAVQELVNKVAAPYDNLPEAHFAMAQAAANANDTPHALHEIEQALALRTDWEMAALVRAQIEANVSNTRAIDDLKEFVGRNPEARDARLTLARLLISQKRYEEAREHFNQLIKSNPDNPDVIYPVAMLALQQGDVDTGRRMLEKLLDTPYPDKSTVHFFLGQIEQDAKNYDAALTQYGLVTAGRQYIAARSRAAQVLLLQGKTKEAQQLLHNTEGNTPAERTQLVLAEAQLLREADQPNESYQVLEKALTTDPDNIDLLYEAALTADRVGKPGILEIRLRHLLKLKPDHAHALNALGYSLADRNKNLDEAYTLITKALSLSPDDPFITDSLGWVLFRQGKLDEARQTLEKAYASKADPEIAAHLGEVLWAMNRKPEARKLLEEAAKQNPDNEVLGEALKKFQL